jgi:hypothetical protein
MTAIRTGAALLLMASATAVVFLKTSQAMPNVPVMQSNTFPMSVRFEPTNLDAGTVQLYQNIANVLNGYNVLPDNRANFFSAYNADNGFSIFLWNASIVAAQQNCNGYLVTLRVWPGMSSTFGTDCIINDLSYSEQYQVNNDSTVVYIGSLDPNGQAGLLSSSIDAY